MGNTRRRLVRGRWAGWAAPAPCRPGTRATGPREAADGGQVAGGMGVREVRVRDVLARRRAQPHPAAREVPPPPLGGGRDGHAAPRGAPAPPVPCHVAAGEVGGSVSVPGLAAQVGVSESTATLVPGRLRGAMARPGCLRRAVGRGRGGRLPRRRARQDEGARAGAVHGHAADARGGRAHLGQARREPPRRAPRDLEPRVLGRRDVPRPVDGGAAVLLGRPLLEALASRARRHHGPGRRLLPGALPPRPAARGDLPPTAPRPARPGASGRRGEYR